MRTFDLLFIAAGLTIFPLLAGFARSSMAPAHAVAPADTLIHNEAFTRAVRAYQEADFERAIDAFSRLAADSAQQRIVRRDALHYLGRAYMAKQEVDRAREALTGMVELEPPPIELDPDIEPPRLMRLYYDVRKTCKGNYTVEGEPSVRTLAVLDFTNNSIDDHDRLEPLSKGFTSLFIHQLNGATGLKVIERERVQWLLDELDLQHEGGRVDPQTAVRAGKLLGAHTVLFGSFIQYGRKMVINARLVDVETSEILMTEQVSGRADRFFDLADELSLKVAQRINVALEHTELGSRTETRSLDAMISYSEGLDLLEKDDYRAAYEKFLEALHHDPAYRRARLKAESIRPLLIAG